MLTIEVTVPRGKFTVEQRRELAGSLTAKGVLASPDEILEATDPGVLELYESLTNSVVTEAEAWVAAGRAVTTEGPSRYLVNFFVGAWTNEMAEHLITETTRRITEFDAGHGGAGEPRVLVHVLGIGKGHYGLQGSVVTPDDFTAMITDANTRGDAEAPPGSFIDPVCGCVVTAEDAVTLERDGVTYGFCCPGCRGHFAKQHDKTAKGHV